MELLELELVMVCRVAKENLRDVVCLTRREMGVGGGGDDALDGLATACLT